MQFIKIYIKFTSQTKLEQTGTIFKCILGKFNSKVCNIVVNGGKGALETIRQIIEVQHKQDEGKAKVPIIIVNHTGRVADLLSMAFRNHEYVT